MPSEASIHVARNTGQIFLIDGPPGCGKTTYLTRQAQLAADKHGPERVVIASLTRTAAAEIAGRDHGIPEANIGTLHAHCWRGLDRPELAETPEGLKLWNARHPAMVLTGGSGTSTLEDAPDADPAAGGRTRADELHSAITIHRARRLPMSEWTEDEIAHWGLWQEFKADTGRLDFTDLIEAAHEQGLHPVRPHVILADEAQDFSRLELRLVVAWAQHAETTVIVGDTRQCHPAGVPVLTTAGYVNVEDLDPTTHRLVSYDRRSGVIVGRRNGYAFKKAERPNPGSALAVICNERIVPCTPNHRWPVRWKPDTDLNVVYLMRRGKRWRVGWCQLFSKGGGLHLGQRARLEKADSAWVLSVHTTKREASVAESIIAAKYGIPTIMFEARWNHFGSEDIDKVYAALDLDDLVVRATRALDDHGRDATFPLWSADEWHAKQGRRHMPLIRACNLLPEAMLIAARHDERTCSWRPFTLESAWSSGPVYSLDVEPHHNYIANGLVTGNSLYMWRGSDPETLLHLKAAQRKTLGQSYRVPRAAHAAAQRWAGRLDEGPADYAPTETEGFTQHIGLSLAGPELLVDGLGDHLAETTNDTFMVLASCGYMLGPLIAELRKRGIPYHNPYRVKQGAWNPMRAAERLRAFLRPDERVWGQDARAWTWKDLWSWVEPLKQRDCLPRGTKSFIEDKLRPDRFGQRPLADQEVPTETLMRLFDASLHHPIFHGDVDWWAANLLAAPAKTMAYPLRVLQRQGHGALRDTPRLIVGTIHSVKGGQADHVYLAPDLSNQGYHHGWTAGGPARDQIIRMFYVGLTRARRSVTLLAPSTGEHVLPELLDAIGQAPAQPQPPRGNVVSLEQRLQERLGRRAA